MCAVAKLNGGQGTIKLSDTLGRQQKRGYSVVAKRSPLSVRASLTLLAAACVLPLAAMAAVLISSYYDRAHAQIASAANGRARSISSQLDREFANTQAALQALSTSPSLLRGDLSNFHRQAKAALANMGAENIVLLDGSGQLLLSTGVPYGTPLPKLPKPPLVARTFATGKPGISDLFMGPVAKHLIYTIAVPVQRKGVVTYSLNATVSPTQIFALLQEQKLPNNWNAVVADSSSIVVSRTSEVERFQGKPLLPGVLEKVNAADEGSFDPFMLDGVRLYVTYYRSQVNRWTVVIGIPLAEHTAGLRRSLIGLVAATLASLVIGLLMAWFFGGRIARSITGLTQPARALGTGEAFEIPRLHVSEAVEVGEALITAAETLRKAKYEALHDGLTGLPNRSLFGVVLNQQLLLCQRNATELAVLYIDLDGFKAVNDTHGHAAGDLLLISVAKRIRGVLRDSDIVARLGGDEFAMVLIHTGVESAKVFASKLIDVVSQPYELGDLVAHVSASVGIATFPVSATDTETLLKKADMAMYAAKASGKRHFRVST